jgi:predicted transcriptional regulator of viral defense system
MDDIRFTTDLLAAGWSPTEIARLSRQGELQRIRRGAYEPPPEAQLSERELHRRLIAATIRQTPVEAVLSHMSAAVLHGLPTWSSHLTRVHLTRDQRSGGKIRRYTHLHVAPLPEVDVCMIDGFRVTTEARTVLDLLRCLPMEKGVPIGDAALRAGLSLEQLAEVAGRCVGWRGMTQARR